MILGILSNLSLSVIKVFKYIYYNSLMGLNNKGAVKFAGVVVTVVALGLLFMFLWQYSNKSGFFAVAPSAAAPTHYVAFTAFGNTSKLSLPSGYAPNFKVLDAAFITNASNTSYNIGSAVGGKAVMTLNGTAVLGYQYEVDILVGVNGSTTLTVPVYGVENSTLKTTDFKIASAELIGTGSTSGQTIVATSGYVESPTASTPSNLVFSGLKDGKYVLQIEITPTSSIASGNSAATYALFNLGSTSGSNALTEPAGFNQPTLENFAINWKV